MRMDEDPNGPIPDYSGNNNDGISQGGITSDNSIDSEVGRALTEEEILAIYNLQK